MRKSRRSKGDGKNAGAMNRAPTAPTASTDANDGKTASLRAPTRQTRGREGLIDLFALGPYGNNGGGREPIYWGPLDADELWDTQFSLQNPLQSPEILNGVRPGQLQWDAGAKDGKTAGAMNRAPTVRTPALIDRFVQGSYERDTSRGSMIVANFGSALEALWANRLRSLLTALGIFIGVAAVIAALSLTQGTSASIHQRISTLGLNLIIVSPGAACRGPIHCAPNGALGAGGSVQSLTTSDAAALVKVPHVIGVSPIITVTSQVVYGNQNWNTRIQGVNTDFMTIQNWQMAKGTWFTSNEEMGGQPVALLGQTVAHNLFDASGTDPVGHMIRIRNQLFRVEGVLQTKGNQGAFDQDDVVFIPITTALTRLKNSTYVDQIQVQADDASNVSPVEDEVTAILERRHRIANGTPDDFRSLSSNQLLQTAQQFTQILTFLLVGIAGISLTVGGIGIMNIMIVSVTERTREIGIRLSIGARRKDIRNQFLIEALALSLVGGMIGMVLGLLIGLGLTSAFGLPFVVTLTSLLMPFVVSATIGVVFGLYPAVRASKLDPIVALRTD